MPGMPRVSVGCELVRAVAHSGRARILGRAARLPSASLSIFNSLLFQAAERGEVSSQGRGREASSGG